LSGTQRVLAPNAKLCELVVPQQAEVSAQAAPPAECEAGCAHHRPVRLSWTKLLKRGWACCARQDLKVPV
jgi:hypothetical protein